MLKLDSGSLICDFAETYHVYNLHSLSVKTAAVLACGLGDNSRIKRKISGLPVPFETLLMARIADVLSLILWSKCKEGTPKPDSILASLLNPEKKESDQDAMVFDSAEDFEKARIAILEGGD